MKYLHSVAQCKVEEPMEGRLPGLPPKPYLFIPQPGEIWKVHSNSSTSTQKWWMKDLPWAWKGFHSFSATQEQLLVSSREFSSTHIVHKGEFPASIIKTVRLFEILCICAHQLSGAIQLRFTVFVTSSGTCVAKGGKRITWLYQIGN